MKTNIIFNKINNLRKTSIASFQTNYFMTPIEDDCATFKNNEAIVFLSKEKHFYKLFYAFINPNSFEQLLKELPNKEIYLEIISKTPLSNELKFVLEKYFKYKTTYSKLYKKLEVDGIKAPLKSKIDTDLIFEKLYSTFNVYFEHLMDKNELINLAKNNRVITVYEKDEMKSFLIYKTQGRKAYLNQIANYGSKENLIELWTLFYQALNNNSIKYLDLWYDTQNKKAENMYKIEQFQPLNQFNFCYEKV